MEPQTAGRADEQHRERMAAQEDVNRRWAIRVVVYVMLLASAGATFLLNDWLWRTAREGRLPMWLPLLPVGTFTAFVVVYVIDRWMLVRRRRYPPVRAFFQVAITVAFLALLWPQQASQLMRGREPAPAPAGAVHLLGYADPEVRAAGCELAGWRHEHELLGELEAMAHDDVSVEVRAACGAAAAKLRESSDERL